MPHRVPSKDTSHVRHDRTAPRAHTLLRALLATTLVLGLSACSGSRSPETTDAAVSTPLPRSAATAKRATPPDEVADLPDLDEVEGRAITDPAGAAGRLAEALEAYESAEVFWQGGAFEDAFAALDRAYDLMAEVDREELPELEGRVAWTRDRDGFQGYTWAIPLPDLMGFLQMQQKSGVLRVNIGSEVVSLVFDAGDLVHASSDGSPTCGTVRRWPSRCGWSGPGSGRSPTPAPPPTARCCAGWTGRRRSWST